MPFRLILRSSRDLPGWVKSFDRPMSFVKNLSRLFNERFNILHELFFIEFVVATIRFSTVKMLLLDFFNP